MFPSLHHQQYLIWSNRTFCSRHTPMNSYSIQTHTTSSCCCELSTQLDTRCFHASDLVRVHRTTLGVLELCEHDFLWQYKILQVFLKSGCHPSWHLFLKADKLSQALPRTSCATSVQGQMRKCVSLIIIFKPYILKKAQNQSSDQWQNHFLSRSIKIYVNKA